MTRDDVRSSRLQKLIVLLAGCGAAALISAAPALAMANPTTPLITNLAGTGTGGAYVPGPASSSPLADPVTVAVAPNGNVYIGDGGNSVVEKVTPDGTLSILAGNGTQGPAVNGPATSSELNDPYGVAADSAGDVYIADTQNREVEKVTPGGQLTIIAGTGVLGTPTAGPATSSKLDYPTAVAVDAAGNVYIADANAHVVEMVTPAGTLSIVAGTGTSGTPTAGPATSSRLSTPSGVGVDAAGNLYIADNNNHVVEKVTPDGTLSIFAGTGTNGAVTPGPATASKLGFPNGVAFDASGDAFIDQSSPSQVEEVTPAGVLSIFAGTGTGGTPTYGIAATLSEVHFPQGLAVTPGGTVYIADAYNWTIDQVIPVPPAAGSAPPAISGTIAIGQTLTAGPGVWAGNPESFAYQWQDCDATGNNCVSIAGATAGSYTIAAGDVGETIRVIVTAGNDGGSGSQTAAQTAVVTTPSSPAPPTTTSAPVITGSPVLTASPRRCPVPAGTLAGTKLGVLTLGDTRGQARRLLPRYVVTANGFDNFCLSGGWGIRAGYASAALAAGRDRAALRGGIVVALTANPHYALDGVRPGASLASTPARLKIGKALHLGANSWYFIPGKAARGVFKVRHGIILEVGIAATGASTGRPAQRRLLTSFKN